MTTEDVKRIFLNEFATLLSKFQVYELGIGNAYENMENDVNKPGVYIYWHPKHKVIIVGKSQSNSRRRALEHIRDNTRKGDLEMASLRGDEDLKILLFNVIDKRDLHWILSMEAFMEWNLSPAIPAGRMG